jgi:hypothetical protein
MNKLLVLGLALGGLALASQSRAATLAPLPSPDPEPIPPPEPTPGVYPGTPGPVPGPADVSVSVPAGYRRLSQSEVTPTLTSTALDILKLSDRPGTKYPFEYDGMSYYAGIEQYQGKRNVSLFVKV